MKYYIFSILPFIFNCKSVEKTNTEIQSWYRKDCKLDNTPGISLDKWYSEIKDKKTKQKQIIVAVVDTQIDLNHEDLKNKIWVNAKEIPNNNIDDDKNGYVDDVNGWNFLGTKSGNYIVWANYEYVRYIRKWKPFFENKNIEEIAPKDLNNFNTYKWALSMLNYYQKFYKAKNKNFTYLAEMYPKAKDTLKYYFPKEDYSLSQLDSMFNKYKLNDKQLRDRVKDNDQDFGALIDYMLIGYSYNKKTKEDLLDAVIQYDSILNKNLNLDYNERVFIGDNETVLEKGYGNNKINAKIKGIRSLNAHSTKVSGIIASNRNNNIGTKGFSNKIKIMPLTISPSGDEHDKDIANAIYYAVDNGAKIINMSFGKECHLEKKWVDDAVKYAEKNRVLIVHSAGNEASNSNNYPNFPDDYNNEKNEEISNNFITVGSVSNKLDSTFVSAFSNYGNMGVDLFAPGDNIYTCIPDNKYEVDGGTSLAAPMVSGTAALIWLYYPKLTAKQVKDIILESSVKYDLEVIVPGTTDKKVKFSELSKSGGVLNVYNAMQLAEKVSQHKQ
jgi:cell wall-associated protease